MTRTTNIKRRPTVTMTAQQVVDEINVGLQANKKRAYGGWLPQGNPLGNAIAAFDICLSVVANVERKLAEKADKPVGEDAS